MGYKRPPKAKRHKLHLKGKSHLQTSSNHQGVKRNFGAQINFIPRSFDSSSVKGNIFDTNKAEKAFMSIIAAVK